MKLEEPGREQLPDTGHPKKPALFEMVGWSWFIMSLLGVLFGVLSLPSLFQLDHLKALLSNSAYNQFPTILDSFNKLIDLFVPMTLIQLGLSAVMTWVSWAFLKRKNWARLVLSGINGIFIVGIIWGAVFVFKFLQGVYEKYDVYDMVEAGFIADYPHFFSLGIGFSVVLLLLPMIWMAWYFHRPKVRDYFNGMS